MMKPVAKRLIASIAVAMGFVFSPVMVHAIGTGNPDAVTPSVTPLTHQPAPETDALSPLSPESQESLMPTKGRDLSTTHFTWGIEVGSSIDLGGNDMSTFDLELVTGYKNKAIQLLGVGAGVRRSFGLHNTFIPVFAVIRTSFRSKPSLCFMHFQAGYSFNSLADAKVAGNICGSLGLGINLSMSRKFMSHIILSYGFKHFTHNPLDETSNAPKNVPLAQLSFGMTM